MVSLKSFAGALARWRSWLAGRAWLDARLRFPLKIETEEGKSFALANIREGSQPESLFAIPGDCRKFDPAQLIERIKQSDVWVEPPG